MAQFKLDLPTLQQSLPLLQGIAGGQGILSQHLQNQGARQTNKFSPALAQALLAQRNAQTGLTKSRIPLTQAQAQSEQYKAQHAPEFFELRKQVAANVARNTRAREDMTQLQRQKMTSLMGNMLSRMANLPGGKSFFANNPGFAKNLLEGMLGASGQFSQQAQLPAPGFGGGQPPQQPMPGQMPGMPGGFPAQGAPPMGGPGQAPGMPIPGQMPGPMPGQPGIGPPGQMPTQDQPPMPGQMPELSPLASAVTDEQVRGAQEATADVLAKQRSDEKTRNQKRFSIVLTKFVNKRKNLPDLFDKYVGAASKDKYVYQLKAGNPDALAFQAFMKTDIPMLANELKRTMGGQATDQETKLMEKIVNPDWWFGDGAQAKSQWNSFVENHKIIDEGLDIPLRDLFGGSAQGGALSEAISTGGGALSEAISTGASSQAGTVSSAPSGTVEMVDEKGNAYAIPHADVSAAMQHGWRHANG